MWLLNGQKCPCSILFFPPFFLVGTLPLSSSFFFLKLPFCFFFSWFFFLGVVFLFLFFFFFSFFDFLGYGEHVAFFFPSLSLSSFLGCGCDSFFFCLFVCFFNWTWFFFGTWFLIFNKWGDWFFFFLVVCHFFVLIGHHFLTRVYE